MSSRTSGGQMEDHTVFQGDDTRVISRRAKDQTAVGGLRAPHMSVKRYTGATELGKWLGYRLGSVSREDDTEA